MNEAIYNELGEVVVGLHSVPGNLLHLSSPLPLLLICQEAHGNKLK